MKVFGGFVNYEQIVRFNIKHIYFARNCNRDPFAGPGALPPQWGNLIAGLIEQHRAGSVTRFVRLSVSVGIIQNINKAIPMTD